MFLSWLKSNGQTVEVSTANPLPVNATVTASAAALANAVAPTYSEGTTNPLSADLTGAMRITGTINASSSMRSTTAAPSYVNGTDNALSSNLTGDLRVIAKQIGTWAVGIDQTTPGSTNAVDVTNFPVTVDTNSGNKSASTIRVVLATDQPALTAALKVDGSAVTQPVSGTVTANAGTNLNTSLLAVESGGHLAAIDTVQGAVADAAWTSGSGTVIALLKAIAAKIIASVAVTGTFWQATQPVSIAATVASKEVRSGTGTRSSVAGAASSTTILAPNANRLGAGIYNDSTAILYLDLSGGTASTSNYTVQLGPNDYYEPPANYTGLITGIWASATGAAKVVEFT